MLTARMKILIFPQNLFGDGENFLSTSALISSVNPANLTEPSGSKYLVCFLQHFGSITRRVFAFRDLLTLPPCKVPIYSESGRGTCLMIYRDTFCLFCRSSSFIRSAALREVTHGWDWIETGSHRYEKHNTVNQIVQSSNRRNQGTRAT